MTSPRRLRVALLTYRGHPHVGGQGVYVHYLSRALAELGHSVEVFSGQPYPELAPGVALTKVPSLDLYRPDDPFRRPRRDELRDPVDVLEYAQMCCGAFPEPLTFSLRVARVLGERRGEFDVVHDNQCLGYGLLRVARHTPVVATVHHPITVDRDLALAAAPDARERARMRRWYAFTRMQGRVARRLPRLLTVSAASRSDVSAAFGVPEHAIGIVHNGVDPELFRPLDDVRRVPGRVIAMVSADLPMKGVVHLVEALAKVRTERHADLVLTGKGADSPGIRAAARRYGVEGSIRFAGRVEKLELVGLYAQAQVAVVPSLYEGFSFPAVEAMLCGVPLVATTGGALPEVAGVSGDTALLVPPGDAGALASAIGTLLDDGAARERLARAARARVLERFTWRSAAEATAEEYRRVLGRC
ncbi:MAG TPA: glycosyltransferase family 4 protein [Actinomycetota bacterium]|nr:glycosyltransferase family 4 protein [Actinomycetota bacterium]